VTLRRAGNAEIWLVKSDRNEERVLKFSEVESIREEVEARKALGWDYHAQFMLKAFDYEADPKESIGTVVLEKATRTLRDRIAFASVDRAGVPAIIQSICSALKEMHRYKLCHLDIKPANIFQLNDPRTGDVIWKLGDFDACRREGEPVSGFTAHYAAPELAAAELEGSVIGASIKMDVFSTGVVVWEVASGRRLVAESLSNQDALTILSCRHGGGRSGSATKMLEKTIGDAIAPLDAALRASLASMLEVEPMRRKDAGDVLHGSLVSGHITTTVRHEANKEVMSYMAEIKEEILDSLGAAEERLREQIKDGNEQVTAQLQEMRKTNLPQLSAAVKQQLLELRCAAEEGDDALLRRKALEAGQLVRDALADTAEMVEGQDASLTKMIESLLEGQPGRHDDDSAVMKKLEALTAQMDRMGKQFGELSAKVDSMSSVQKAAFDKLEGKLDQLLLHEHEQVFSYFMLKPKPEKGRMGRALSRMNPKKWFSHSMLLVPLYKDAAGQLQEAPVNTKYGGFKVSEPTAFVKKHPRMVQLGMLALKISIKIAAAQLAVNIPAATLDAIGPATDDLINEMLTMGCEAMKEVAEDDEEMDEYYEKLDDVLASTFDEPSDAPDEALEKILANDKFKELSKQEYASFSAWMDKTHTDWRTTCGLVSEINPETGRAEFVPPGMYLLV
jgi:hypothetical protein